MIGLFDKDFKVTDDETGEDITEEVVRKVLDGTYQRELTAEAIQEEAAALIGTQRYNRNLGMMPVMNVTPEVYYHWVAREGAECWADNGFRKDLMRDNESLRARVEMPGDRVSFAGMDARLSPPKAPQGLVAASRFTPLPSKEERV